MKKELLEQINRLDVPDDVARGWINEWDPIIKVDRTVHHEYPDFVKEVKHLEFELSGPAEFDIRSLKPYLHWKYKDGLCATGYEIYDELNAKKMLESCLNLSDILAIQFRGAGFYWKHFAGMVLLAWKSVVLNDNGDLNVPFLYEFMYGYGRNEVEVNLSWRQLDCYCSSRGSALCHTS